MGSSPRVLSSVTPKKRKTQRAPFEHRVTRFSILLAAPGLVISGILIWLQPWSVQSKLILMGAELLASLLVGAVLHDHIVRPLQTLSNVVGALRDEDYSFRARLAVPNDALGELSLEVNALAELIVVRDVALAVIGIILGDTPARRSRNVGEDVSCRR